MEDPEKRKERLKAMRLEAAQTDVSIKSLEIPTMMPGHLSNPLAETSTTLPRQEESFGNPRFDYYTDPMSAFSGNRRNKADQQIKRPYTSSPGNHMVSPVPRFPPSLPGGDQQIHYNPGALRAQAQYMDPRGTAHPSSPHYGTSHEAWNQFVPPAGNFQPWHSPHTMAGPFLKFQGSPEPGNRLGGRSNYNHPLNLEQQNPNWVGRTSPGSGRGRGFGRNTSPNFGRNGSYDHTASPTLAAERFYDKSMAEDPWQYLKPVIWKSSSDASISTSKGPSSSDFWHHESTMLKKARVSEAASKSTSNQQSLSEYLAASLDEAINESSI